MAYGEKYKYYFYWDHDSSNNYYKVSFLEDGYASTVTTLTGGATPWVLNVKGQKDSIDQVILGTSASMEIVVDRSDVDVMDPDFLESDYKDYIVKLIQDPDGTPITKFVGFLLASNSTREYQGSTFTYSLEAVDGIADLKNKSFSTNGKSYGSPYTGFENILTIIKTAIGKVADFSDLQLDFRIQLGTYSDQMVSTENAFAENEIVQELFSQEKDGVIEFDSCYEVLEKILAPFYCSMSQVDGYYWIWCKGERSSYYFEYDWATLTQQSRTSYTRSVTMFGVSTTMNLFGRGSLSKVPGYSEFTVVLNNRNYDPELITNGGMDSNITGWTNGDAPAAASTWTDAFEWNTHPTAQGGFMSLAWAGAAASGNYYFHTSSTFNIEYGAGKQNVDVYVRMERYSETPSGLSDPNIVIRLWNSSDGYKSGTTGAQAIINVGGFTVYRESFDVTSGITVNANDLEVQVQVTDATTTSVQFYVDYITASQPSTNDPTDWQYNGFRTTGDQAEIKKTEVYIAEKQESDNDICSLKDDGGNYTSTWDRYGKTTDDIPLITVLQQYVFNANSGFKSYVTCTIHDPDEEILHNDMLNDRSLGLAARYLDIVGTSINYREATHKVQLKENGILPVTDTTFGGGHFKLETQYGESTD
jgi:hypothetical protein